ncbi:MAG TPA: PilZ domain-containing protein [bacterium]|nr:PilZ domain-containing protein [bacterium]
MPEANMFVEKRIHPRVSVKIPVKYRIIEDQKELETVFERKKNEQTTRTMDVSLGGLYIVASTVLNVGSILRLDIALPGRSSIISAFAEVVWANETGGGLHFLAMKEEDVDFLKGYLNKVNDEK